MTEELIKNCSKQLSMFPDENPNRLLHLNHCTFVGVNDHFFNHKIHAIQEKIEFADLPVLLLLRKLKSYWALNDNYTNLVESLADNKTIIERYHQLNKIEQAFRISKNDLYTRPIFHFKEQPIKLHILICFMT